MNRPRDADPLLLSGGLNPGGKSAQLAGCSLQCRGPLQDFFSERTIPRDQPSDQNDSHYRRVARVDEGTPIHTNRTAKTFLVDSLQLPLVDGSETLRPRALQGGISFA